VFDSELEAFKAIDLRAYAAAQGYALDRKESSRGSAVMRHPGGDKIIIKRDMDNHYIYFSVRDGNDHGTILDFVQHRLGLSLGAARKELRPWAGQPSTSVPPCPPLPRVVKDRLRVEREFMCMQEAPDHPYLLGERRIAPEVLASSRFSGKIRIDGRGNAVFPHVDGEGLAGYELKNHDFTGFASGGMKGLWLSNEEDADEHLVFCESAIDALSYAVLFPDDHTRYASTGGKTNPLQRELIRSAAARMPGGSEIVAAMDADEAGRELAEIVRRAVGLVGRVDLRFRIHEPEGFKDWNDALRAKPTPLAPCPAKAPSIA
jgi:hypothetical protein